jgi:hypothetical protein
VNVTFDWLEQLDGKRRSWVSTACHADPTGTASNVRTFPTTREGPRIFENTGVTVNRQVIPTTYRVEVCERAGRAYIKVTAPAQSLEEAKSLAERLYRLLMTEPLGAHLAAL